MKKFLVLLMVLACALLFSCATNSDAASDASGKNPTVINAGPGARNDSFIAAALADDPLIGKWAAKYEFAQNPVFNGVPLIVDNGAFLTIPADIKARKEKAEALMDENRFLDAWYAYGDDDNEYIIALKILHVIDVWVDTIQHQVFVLSNLEPDQNVYEYRDSPNQKGETLFFDPAEVAKQYTDKYCDGIMPPILELALGCYYEDAAATFGEDWILPLDDTYELSTDYFTSAICAGVYNNYALDRAVNAFIGAGYFTDALELVHCLELCETDYGYNFYQEARAYMCKGEYQNAIPCAARALVYSTVPEDVSAYAQIMADGFMYDSGDVSSALAVLNAAKPYMDDLYYFSSVFMKLDILMYAKNRYPGGDYGGLIKDTLSDAFAFEYRDANYLYELTDYFYNYDFIDLGIEWIEGILKDYDGDPAAYGNLNFELGQFYLQAQNYERALTCFNTAEENLKEAGLFDPDTSNIPYYQKLCREQLLSNPKKNKI